MPTIFISYRREDSAGHAGRLFDRLRERFGRGRVFLDVVGIEAGVDFVETIDQAISSCDVLLAVIGREWLSCCGKQGRRRLEDPNDFIRAEVSTALKRNVRVVPVLVEGAEMPPTEELPEELQPLTRRQAVELRDSRWDADVEALITALDGKNAAQAGKAVLPPGEPPPDRVEPAGVETGWKPSRKALLWGMGAIVTALLAVGALRLFTRSQAGRLPPAGGLQEPAPSLRTVRTPQLVGLSLEAALENLRKSGLTAGRQEARQTADAPARQVLSQQPEPGKEIGGNSSVDLVYAESRPDSRITIPNVVGADVRQVMDTLRGAGLEVSRRPEPSAEAQYKVLRQEPAAGTRVKRGTRVTLVYSTPVEAKAPDQAGEKRPAASPQQVDKSISRPQLISSVAIQYPELARIARVTGVVIVETIIDEQGNIESARVLQGLPMGLDRAAVEAVRQWKFKPAMRNGTPVKVYFTLTVNCQIH